MAEVRCPHCDARNPDGAERCWNCHESLAPEGADDSNWLDSLREDGSSEESVWGSDPNAPSPQTPAGSSSEDDPPDWLARIQERSQAELDQTPSEEWGALSSPEAEPAQGLPDWLLDMTGDQAGSAGDDWLSALGSSDQEPQGASDSAAGAQPDEEWLKNLQDWQSTQETGGPPETPPAEPAAPTEIQPEQPFTWQPEEEDEISPAGAEVFSAPDAGEDDGLGWLANLPMDEDTPDEPHPPSAPAPFLAEEDGLDWLSRLSDGEPSAAEPAQASPFEGGAFLSGWDQAGQEQEQPQPDQPSSAFQSDQDQDQDEFAAGPVAFSSASETGPQASDPAELPAWLFSDDADSPAQPAEPQPPAQQSSQADPEPDWMRAPSALEPLSEQPLSEQPPSEQPPSEPQPPEPTGQADEHIFAAEPGQMPDWLGQIGGDRPQDEAKSESAPQPSEPPQTPSPDETSETGQEAAEMPAAPFTPFGEDGLPDWLSEESLDPPAPELTDKPAFVFDETGEFAEPLEPEDHPFADEEVPEWLASGENAEPAEPGAAGSGGLTPAQLPGWLEAMRPVEAVAPDSAAPEGGRTEKSGPLAGIPGPLPTEAISAQYRKPPVYSIRLHVSDKQRAHATLLEESVAEESKPVEVRRARKPISDVLFRLLIALLLIGGLIFSGALQRVKPVSNEASFGYINFKTELQSLAQGAPVLVAFDYTPAYSAEMRLAASGVLEQLLARGARITAISTTPAGPVLAEDLIGQVAAAAGVQNKNDQFTNLGYLAGGILSLQEFALQPQQVTRYQFDSPVTGKRAWDQPALQGVTSLDTFSLAIVMTDTPDVGRAWVEQVAPFFGNTPLLMITSAQAGPMLQPYVASGQVDGLIDGVLGGSNFAVPTNQQSVSPGYWNAFYAGVRIAIVLIVLGALIQGILSLIKSPKV